MSGQRAGTGQFAVAEFQEERTGLSSQACPHVTRQVVGSDRPLSMAWISDELLAKTQRVWSKAFGRPVGVEEAVEILANVKHLAEAAVRAREGAEAQ